MRQWTRRLLTIAFVAIFLGGGALLAQEKMILVNINTADEAALVTLEGIGKTRAQAIILHRQTHGPFTSVEDVKGVSGIGEKVFDTIKSKITVGNGQQ